MSAVTINWFEIPAQDLNRASEFYGAVLGAPLGTMDGPDGPMHVFPGEDGAAGALVPAEVTPTTDGVLVYLGCADIDATLQRAQQGGGDIVMPRSSIGPFGFIGKFKDSEGNVVALHTPSG